MRVQSASGLAGGLTGSQPYVIAMATTTIGRVSTPWSGWPGGVLLCGALAHLPDLGRVLSTCSSRTPTGCRGLHPEAADRGGVPRFQCVSIGGRGSDAAVFANVGRPLVLLDTRQVKRSCESRQDFACIEVACTIHLSIYSRKLSDPGFLRAEVAWLSRCSGRPAYVASELRAEMSEDVDERGANSAS